MSDPRITDEVVKAATLDWYAANHLSWAKAGKFEQAAALARTRSTLTAALPHLAPQSVVDREAHRCTDSEAHKPHTWAYEASAFVCDGGAPAPQPVVDREAAARAIDPDAFDEEKPRSLHPAAVIQWAARRHMAYNAADAVLALLNGGDPT